MRVLGFSLHLVLICAAYFHPHIMSHRALLTTAFPNSTFMSNVSDCSSTETFFYTNFLNASYNATSTTAFTASSTNFTNTASIDTSHTALFSSFQTTSISTRFTSFSNYTATTTQIVPIPTIINITVTSVILSTDLLSSLGYTTLTETLPCPLTNASFVSVYTTFPPASSNYTSSCANKTGVENVTTRVSGSSFSNAASPTILSSSLSYTSHGLSTTHSNTSSPIYQSLNNTLIISEKITFVTTLATNRSSTIESILIHTLASSATTSPLIITTTPGAFSIPSITKLSTVLTFQATNITLYPASTSYQNTTALGNGYSGTGSTEIERTSVRIVPTATVPAILTSAIVSTAVRTPISRYSSLDYSTSTSIRRSSITVDSTSTANTNALSSTLPAAIQSGGGSTPFMPNLKKCRNGAPFALVVVFLAIAW